MSIDQTKKALGSIPHLYRDCAEAKELQELVADHTRLEAEVKAVREENARLRDALEIYARLPNVKHMQIVCGGLVELSDGECGVHSMHIAQAALQPNGGKDEH